MSGAIAATMTRGPYAPARERRALRALNARRVAQGKGSLRYLPPAKATTTTPTFAVGEAVIHIMTDAKGGEIGRRLGRVVERWSNYCTCPICATDFKAATESESENSFHRKMSCANPKCGQAEGRDRPFVGRPLQVNGRHTYDVRFANGGGFASVHASRLIRPEALHVVKLDEIRVTPSDSPVS